jgi:hypothetical protein
MGGLGVNASRDKHLTGGELSAAERGADLAADLDDPFVWRIPASAWKGDGRVVSGRGVIPYAGDGEGRPLCECHGVLMTRRVDRRSGWRCSVAHRKAQQTYYYTWGGIWTEHRRTQKRRAARIAAMEEQLKQLYGEA